MERKSFWRRYCGIALSFLLILVVIVVLIRVWVRHQPEKVNYQTVTAVKQALENIVLATGQLDALTKVEVGTQASGQVQSLSVAVGDQVVKGQLLATIDPTKAQNRVAMKQADLQIAQAQLTAHQAALAAAQLKQRRIIQLTQSQSIAQQERDEAQVTLAKIQSDIERTQAEIQKAQFELQNTLAVLTETRITAPIAGTVVQIAVKPGETLVATQTAQKILTVADLQTMTVKARISEADVLGLKPGLSAYFTLLGDPQRRFQGQLRIIELASLKETKNSPEGAVFYQALFEVPNAEGLLRLDMTAVVGIVLARIEQAVVIPLAAVQKTDKERYHIQVLAQGKPQQREVRLGIRNEVSVQVLQGVTEGETVIVSTLAPAKGSS